MAIEDARFRDYCWLQKDNPQDHEGWSLQLFPEELMIILTSSEYFQDNISDFTCCNGKEKVTFNILSLSLYVCIYLYTHTYITIYIYISKTLSQGKLCQEQSLRKPGPYLWDLKCLYGLWIMACLLTGSPSCDCPKPAPFLPTSACVSSGSESPTSQYLSQNSKSYFTQFSLLLFPSISPLSQPRLASGWGWKIVSSRPDCTTQWVLS